ncbi:Fanconi anemia group M protein isoform X2 [Narcine bancroftii]|uniref:Fanconi anemia group M protein isoform X2 n=1 Tax=Narcine bancroftii TaxID=1343680 RepID=UPI0038322E54
MNGGRQRTLFQSWGTQSSSSQPRADRRPEVGLQAEGRRRPGDAGGAAAAAQDGFEEGEDDDVLLVAVFEAERGLDSGGPSSSSRRAESRAALPGFDLSSGDMWIYPTNWPLRTYQFDMVRAALFHNTLVCLPTGLGKTFIAAVLMYNFYRWYPTGKIVFMAPTKPLVAQQIEACYKVMGIPQSHMAEMTGHTQALNRQTVWKTRRVFFLTPQVMMNDISRGACPASDVKCLVVDEAHKALGNHAYCQVVKELCNHTRQFRVLALTATPGGDAKAVQQVISNLMIARLEVRAEDSIDVQPYSYQRHVEKFIVPLGSDLIAIQSLYLQILEAFTRRLLKIGALLRKDTANLTKYQIILSREQFRKNPPANIVSAQRGMVEGDYGLCISLYHGYELLLQMGMRSLYNYLKGILDGSKGMTRVCNELCKNAVFMEMYDQLQAMFSNSQAGSKNEKQLIYSHPKLQKLEEVVVNHFQSWATSRGPNSSGGKADGTNSRVMIFSSYRDSVQEIAEMLNKHQPLVKVMTFIGHASGKNSKGFTQKEQLEVMKCFREGGYNVLVSTCVGEEGLDIGEVDLIICFDAQKSPIRMIQRMGRTGRKREGKIVVLLAEGREERTYNQSQCSKRSIFKTILGNGNKSFHLYANSPRMVPSDLNPAVHKMYITTGEYEPNNVSRKATKKGRKSVNKQSKLKEDGLLTAEELEFWDRKFRLRDDLGMPRLMLLPFEIVKDEPKNMEQENGTIRELSLSEWSLWQNHSLSTHFVGHSDRCQHFISIMDMIDLMKQEESNCGYSLEIMPYLNKDDIFEPILTPKSKFTSTSIVTNGEKCKVDQFLKPIHERKKSKNTNVNQNNMWKLMDKDDEYLNSSKMKRTKDHYSFITGEGTNSKEAKESVECVPRNCRSKEAPSRGAASKREEQIHQSEGETEVDTSNNVQQLSCFDLDTRNILEDHIKINLNEDSCGNESTKTKSKIAGTRKIENGDCLQAEPINDYVMGDIMTDGNLFNCNELNSVDPGHNSQLNATTVCEINLSNLFYLPESSLVQDHKMHQRSSNSGRGENRYYSLDIEHPNCNSIKRIPTSIETVLENVTSFLNTSPPLDKFLFLEEVNFEEKGSPSGISKIQPVNVLNPNKNDSLPNNIKSAVCIENATSEDLSNHGNPGSSPSWDDLFDRNIDYKGQLNTSEEEIFNPSKHCHNKKEESKINMKDELFVHENSLPLFEDTLLHAGLSSLCVPNNKMGAIRKNIPGLEQQSTLLNESIQNVSNKSSENGEIEHNVTQELLLHKTFQSQTIFKNTCVDQYRSIANDVSSNISNRSDKLFSVNFDLGFSLEDIVKDSDASITNTSCNKNTESSRHFAGKSENVEGTKMDQDFTASELFVEETELKRECSTPISLKHAFLRPNQMACNEEQHLTTQDWSSPICQLDRGFLFTSSPAFASITPEKKYSSSKFCDTVSSKPLLKNNAVISKNAALESDSGTPVKCDASGMHGKKSLMENKSNIFCKNLMSPINGQCNSESEDEVIRRPNKKIKLCVLESPKLGFTDSEDDDFRGTSNRNKKDTKLSRNLRRPWRKHHARQFLDEEAELSSEGAENVSSDEDDSDHIIDTSLKHFINDESQLSEVSSDVDMQEIYLKSVRSPNIYKKKMVYNKNNMAIFSQIPEQDESYLEDSFCVRDDDVVNFDLIGENQQYLTLHRTRSKITEKEKGKVVVPRKKRSRVVLVDDSSEEELDKNAKSQFVIQNSKSKHTKEDEKNLSTTKPILGSSFKKVAEIDVKKPSNLYSLDRSCDIRLNLQACVSEALDFHVEQMCSRRHTSALTPQVKYNALQDKSETKSQTAKPHCNDPVMEQALANYTTSTISSEPKCKDHLIGNPYPVHPGIAPLKVLVDTREISSGPNLLSSLRFQHNIKAEICSLNGCDYIVSNRMAVERKFLLEFANSVNRSKFVERIQHLQATFERVCVIVEKDRTKPGDTSRAFQRTKYYDGLLSALTTAGIKILFSSNQEETAGLLAELARVEARKNAAITVPSNVSGLRQHILQFYLSIPDVSYITALNLCYQFSSVKEAANSSVTEIAARAKVGNHRAEKIYRYLHYSFDLHMLPNQPGKTKWKQSLST